MIKLFIALLIGCFIGIVTMALAVVSGDAERCAECQRRQQKRSE